MKKYLVLAICSLGLNTAMARPQLCGPDRKELVTCMSTAMVAFYSFVSICSDETGLGIMMDAGGISSPGLMPATVNETDGAWTYTATGDGTDGVQMLVKKNPGAQKTNGILSYVLFNSIERKGNYSCRVNE